MIHREAMRRFPQLSIKHQKHVPPVHTRDVHPVLSNRATRNTVQSPIPCFAFQNRTRRGKRIYNICDPPTNTFDTSILQSYRARIQICYSRYFDRNSKFIIDFFFTQNASKCHFPEFLHLQHPMFFSIFKNIKS